MAKSFIGIDIGHRNMKIVQTSGKAIKKSVVVEVPDNLVKSGQIVSIETTANLIRETMKNAGMSGNSGAIVLSDEKVYLKNITMPQMDVDQLKLNLPYEFKDYITDELKNYVFDFAMRDASSDGTDEEGPAMNLLAAAAPKELLEDVRDMMRKAGLKMEKAAPVEYGYIGLIRSLGYNDPNKEFCFLDLGHEAIRLHIFRGEDFVVSRILDMGISAIESRVADDLNVDVHLAHTYLNTNYNDCQGSEVCRNAYGAIVTEIQRAINFYQFSNPDNKLNEILVCGGGSVIQPLVDEIKAALRIDVNNFSDLMGKIKSDDNNFMLALAYGITQD